MFSWSHTYNLRRSGPSNPHADGVEAGSTRTFGLAQGDFRYLRVQVPANTGKYDVIAVIGHELQHALEIAAHPLPPTPACATVRASRHSTS